jgi:hypothetical protein
MKATFELVSLENGSAVPVAAIQLQLALEERGFSIRADGPTLCIAPASRLTIADQRAIRLHRDALMALVLYCETARVQ